MACQACQRKGAPLFAHPHAILLWVSPGVGILVSLSRYLVLVRVLVGKRPTSLRLLKI